MNRLRKLCTMRSAAMLALATIFAIFASSYAAAQSAGVGAITGTVEDAAQAVIPGAAVTVTNVDTNVVHSYSTNAAGIYTAPFLQPGHYKISAKAANFGTTEARGLTLLVGQTLTLNLTMSVKTETTTIEVEGSGAILDTEKTEVSQVMDQHLVQNLPVNARNWSSFVLLTPAVTQDGGSGLISFHGISGLYNQNYVDGANNNQMLFAEARGRASGAPYVYSIDSIKEFQAEASNYSVEFGQAAGGQVNAITKSGTNMLHGDLFYYLRYPDLNALDPYSKYQALNGGNKFLLTQPIHQQNQFGGSVGGALVKDKLFYFLTYDGFRKVGRVLYSDSNTISTTAQGVYSSTKNASYVTPAQCPTVSNSSYTGTYHITDTQCLAGINFLAQVANVAAGVAPPSRYAQQDLFFPRLDYHVNAKNDVFVDFNWANFQSTNGYSANPTFTNSSPTTNGPTYYHERFLVGGLTTVLSDRSVNQIHAQWGRDLETAGANAAGPSVDIASSSSSSSRVVTFGMPNALPRIAEPDEKRIQFSDVFSHTMGRHTLKFGGDLNVIHEVMINLYQGGGLYGYGESTATANFQDWIFDAFAGQAGNTDPYAGYHYSTFVQTVDTLNTKANTQGSDDFWMKMIDGFAEDSWKVNQKLTLTAGVRYDVQLTPAPGTPNTNYAPISTYYTQSIKNVMNRVQPRVGFSYQVYPGTVVRGGYGIFSGLNQGSTYYAMRVENGVVQVNYNASGCMSSCTAAAAVRYPNVPYQPTGPSLSGALYPVGGAAPSVSGSISSASAISFHGLDPNFVPPYSHEMDLSVEQALPGKFSLMVGYVGTRGMRLPVFVDANLIGQKPSGTRTYNLFSGVNNTGTVTRQITVPVYQTADRANPLLAKSLNAGFSVANTWYNGLVATVRRPFSHGLEFVANYTWSHASDTGQVGGSNGTFFGGDVPLDPNNIRGENGLSDTDIRNRFTLSFSYQPTIAVQNRAVRTAVNGFRFSGSEIASSGQPIYLAMSGTVSGLAEGGIYGGAISSGSGSASTGRPPQIGRNSIVGPGFNDFDLRASREVKLHNQLAMQFSVDAFNLMNHRIITGVNGTYSSYAAPITTGSSATTATINCANSGTGIAGCIAPYSGTGQNAFGAASGTNNSLYGPRQVQVAAKFTF